MGCITELLDRAGKGIAIIGFTTLCALLIIFACQQKDEWFKYLVLVFSHIMTLIIGHLLRLEGSK